MSSRLSTRGATAPSETRGPTLVPILMIGHGRVYLPGPEGPQVARKKNGNPFDLLDVADLLAEKHRQAYVVDLDGIERNRAQLDYLQELSRDLELWVDAGVRTGDQAIDILVAGARRAVLSTAYLQGTRELKRAWKVTPELALEIEIRDGKVGSSDPGWAGMSPALVAKEAREIGVQEIVLSPREQAVDWPLAHTLAGDGATWVDGTFELTERSSLEGSGARGAFFHIGQLLEAVPGTTAAPPPVVRDDET